MRGSKYTPIRNGVAYDHEFECPRCGSSHYGSHQRADGTLERMCHGRLPDDSNCNFTWHEDDDPKYMFDVGGPRPTVGEATCVR